METVLTGEGYAVARDVVGGAVALHGVLRLNGLAEYTPIIDVLNETAAGKAQLTLNLTELEFLNSSGIAMLSRFVIDARNGGLALLVRASPHVPWQGKSLRNLQRLMPALELVFD